jgi:hypothetical protein
MDIIDQLAILDLSLNDTHKWFYSLIFFKLKAIRKIKTILLKYGDMAGEIIILFDFFFFINPLVIFATI